LSAEYRLFIIHFWPKLTRAPCSSVSAIELLVLHAKHYVLVLYVCVLLLILLLTSIGKSSAVCGGLWVVCVLSLC